MRIIRFKDEEKKIYLAAITQKEQIYTLPYNDILEITRKAEEADTTAENLINDIIKKSSPLNKRLEELQLLTPIEAPEVWAAGVTYQASMKARNHETTEKIKSGDESFYDKVYNAERPELFLKSTQKRTIGPNQNICLRSDSNWQIPEPELSLVLNERAEIIGYTIGNDMSSRDIEGENPLYLPQAKIWKNSCSIGPSIRLVETVNNPYDFEIICRIYRKQSKVFEDSTKLSQLKRKLEELTYFLAKDNFVFGGTVLMTGTCVVPPNDFTLEEGDKIEIEVPGIGVLSNPVKSKPSPIL